MYFWNWNLNIGRNRKPRKEITTCLELGTHFLDSLLNHGQWRRQHFEFGHAFDAERRRREADAF